MRKQVVTIADDLEVVPRALGVLVWNLDRRQLEKVPSTSSSRGSCPSTPCLQLPSRCILAVDRPELEDPLLALRANGPQLGVSSRNRTATPYGSARAIGSTATVRARSPTAVHRRFAREAQTFDA